MNCQEISIWEKINNSGKTKLEAKWLKEVYSPNHSIELKKFIAEQIGLLSKEGWTLIKFLFKQYGIQPELIHAAGICHQPEAKDWLLMILATHEEFNVATLAALKCWGGSLSKRFFEQLLCEPEQAKRLAALELLSFKAYQLSDEDLLDLTQELLTDFRDPVVMATIQILQRRNGIAICNSIVTVAQTGSDSAARAALMALGGIGTKGSYEALIKLSQQLPIGMLRDLAQKQLEHQYRFTETTSQKQDEKHNETS